MSYALNLQSFDEWRLPTIASVRPAPAAWLRQVYECVRSGRSDAGGEIIYDQIDQLLGEAKWRSADAVLAAIDLDELDALTMLSFLTITGAARDRLKQRPAYFASVRARLTREMTPERLARVLVGLE